MILKGQANARLYPDKQSRQPGDIDIWVEGGRESVVALMKKMGLLDKNPVLSYHHAHLPPTKDGVIVEVHYRPSSGSHNPITNSRLQRWLLNEIQTATMVEEGFCVPSIRFALVMQLSHIQRHFLSGGIGLRHVCDYYCLLWHSTPADRQLVAGELGKFGLLPTAGALMWVLDKVLGLDTALMLCEQDAYRGEWMLRDIMSGGNFGQYAKHQKMGIWRRLAYSQWRNIKLIKFDFWEQVCSELGFMRDVIATIPERIRRRSFSIAEANKRDAKKQK